MDRWSPPLECSDAEKRLMKLAGRSRKLFVFMREHRQECSRRRFSRTRRDVSPFGSG